jgi:RimJ/RimL family protein N-acetyltransferase
MFTVWADEEPVGLVGYWNVTHQQRDVYECAYGIFQEFQGRGLAAAAMTACLEYAAAHGDREDVYAYPNVTNEPSNALCRRLGFVLEGEQDFEYPKGHPIRANAWRYALGPLRAG